MNIHTYPTLRWLSAGLVLALAGCGIVPKKTEIAIYDPQPRVQADASWPQVDTQLVVLRPNAERLVNSSRIIVRPVPGEVQVYKGATWSQPAPDILQDAIVRTLHAVPALLAGEMEKATLQIHTSKPPRPKPPRREPGEGGGEPAAP